MLSRAEAKKEETFELPPVVVEDQGSPYYMPQSSLSHFPEPVKDTPQSITIIPQKIIEEQAGSTLRGYNARNDMFIDGVRDQGSYFRDSFNIEAVEVLKGPSSTFFGRGSTGGIINQVSKTPRLDPAYSATFSGGRPLFIRGTGDINQPLGKTVALRVNLMVHRNDVAERDVVENMRFGFAPSIAFGLGIPTQLTLSYLVQHEDSIPGNAHESIPYETHRTPRSRSSERTTQRRTSFSKLENDRPILTKDQARRF